MKALLHSNEQSAVESTERVLQQLATMGMGSSPVTFARKPDGTFDFDPDGWIKVNCDRPSFIAWAALHQGYVASLRTEPGETADLARVCAGKAPEPTPPRQWPMRSGMKQNIAPVIANACRALTDQGLNAPTEDVGHSFVLEEFFRHLWELADRFYSGEVEVVDEFLQLYCMDRQRDGDAAKQSRPPSRRLGRYCFIARDDEQIRSFIQHHGIARDQVTRLCTLKDVTSRDPNARIFRLPGAYLEGDLERRAAARRLVILPVSAKTMEGLEPFDK